MGIYKNLIHVCKKTCFRATMAATNNNEYKSVCTSSSDSNANIYAYCDNKLDNFSIIQKESCKLDMCNLCCVTMDSMKSKNFSADSLKRCYADCSSVFNVLEAAPKNTEAEECHQKPLEKNDENNSENYNDFSRLKSLLEE